MKDAICFICEKTYDSLEEAEVCEQSHDENPRERGDDDGIEYSDPRDALAERLED